MSESVNVMEHPVRASITKYSPRLTVRGMMVGVAILAVMLSVWLKRRRDYCLIKAMRHAEYEAMARTLEFGPIYTSVYYEPGDWEKHGRLKNSYLKVASRPWERLPDDPFPDFGP